jgi:hypothetical protein
MYFDLHFHECELLLSTIFLDVNECVVNNESICAAVARTTCVNTIGSYQCQCYASYEMNITSNVCDGKFEFDTTVCW